MQNLTNMQKVLIVLLILGAFGLGAYFCPKNSSPSPLTETQMEETEATVVDTSNWLVYRNETLGFQLKHPETYEVIENAEFRGVKVPVFVRERNKETFDNNISIHKTKSIFNKEISERFYWGVTSVIQNPNLNSGISFVISYFTGDAYFSRETYLFTAWQPSSPADKGTVESDVLIAEVEGGLTEMNTNSVVEEIANTIELLPLVVY